MHLIAVHKHDLADTHTRQPGYTFKGHVYVCACVWIYRVSCHPLLALLPGSGLGCRHGSPVALLMHAHPALQLPQTCCARCGTASPHLLRCICCHLPMQSLSNGSSRRQNKCRGESRHFVPVRSMPCCCCLHRTMSIQPG